MNRHVTKLRLDNGFWSFHASVFAQQGATPRPFLSFVLTNVPQLAEGHPSRRVHSGRRYGSRSGGGRTDSSEVCHRC